MERIFFFVGVGVKVVFCCPVLPLGPAWLLLLLLLRSLFLRWHRLPLAPRYSCRLVPSAVI